MEKHSINVNELVKILKTHFKQDITISEITYARCGNKNPGTSLIGVGGQLNIYFEKSVVESAEDKTKIKGNTLKVLTSPLRTEADTKTEDTFIFNYLDYNYIINTLFRVQENLDKELTDLRNNMRELTEPKEKQHNRCKHLDVCCGYEGIGPSCAWHKDDKCTMTEDEYRE